MLANFQMGEQNHQHDFNSTMTWTHQYFQGHLSSAKLNALLLTERQSRPNHCAILSTDVFIIDKFFTVFCNIKIMSMTYISLGLHSDIPPSSDMSARDGGVKGRRGRGGRLRGGM